MKKDENGEDENDRENEDDAKARMRKSKITNTHSPCAFSSTELIRLVLHAKQMIEIKALDDCLTCSTMPPAAVMRSRSTAICSRTR
jgi:hypothetical protein